jgi:hypothetical protein
VPVVHAVRVEMRSWGAVLRWRPKCRCGWVGDWRDTERKAREDGRQHKQESGGG